MLDELMRLRGASLQIYDAPQFIFAYARSQGYHIPSYPYDPTSELRAFLADWEVADIPAWYARIGVDAGSYAVLAQRRLLVARDDAFRRKAFLMSIPERTTDDECASLVERVVAFLSGGRTDDPTIF